MNKKGGECEQKCVQTTQHRSMHVQSEKGLVRNTNEHNSHTETLTQRPIMDQPPSEEGKIKPGIIKGGGQDGTTYPCAVSRSLAETKAAGVPCIYRKTWGETTHCLN